jgi:hypothetical protein
VVEKEGIKTQTIIKWKDRIVRQTIEKKDTILKRIQVTNTKTLKPDLKWYQKYWWVWIIVGIVFSVLMVRTANKITYIK